MAAAFADVARARDLLAGVIHRTPVLRSRTFDALAGARIFLKAEGFQRGGSFKFRGAYTRLAALSPAERQRGVVAFSSGNHAQGVALAARELGVQATIVMPHDAPATKVTATRGYGAEIVRYDRLREDREALARQLAEKRGLTLVPPYDHPLIMAGQGTAALELLEEVPGLDLLLVPLGGGGLLSGCVMAAQGCSPATRVFGVETETADDWVRSLEAGERVRIAPPATIADGIRTEQPGALTFPVVRAHAAGVATVSDDEVKETMRFLLTRLKVLVEPTGAVGAALALSGRLRERLDACVRAGGYVSLPEGELRVGVILSGGNVDTNVLCQVLTET